MSDTVFSCVLTGVCIRMAGNVLGATDNSIADDEDSDCLNIKTKQHHRQWTINATAHPSNCIVG